MCLVRRFSVRSKPSCPALQRPIYFYLPGGVTFRGYSLFTPLQVLLLYVRTFSCYDISHEAFTIYYLHLFLPFSILTTSISLSMDHHLSSPGVLYK